MNRFCSIMLLGIALSATTSAYATSNVSAKFDGIYEGAATPAPAVGAEGCSAFALGDISITKGFLNMPPSPTGGSINGLITEEGYVSAFLTRPGHQRSPFDGRLENDVIVAGFIEADSGCAWVVHLRRRH